MVKLLEFKSNQTPPNTSQSDIVVENMLMEDVWMGMTPDQTRLRYKGPQYVFMWDACRDTDWLESHGIKRNRDYVIESWNAMTERRFLPFENGTPNNRNFSAYLPRTVNWYKIYGEDNEVAKKLKTLEPHQVAGRIISMSLEGLRQLDAYYGNTASHTRELIPVFQSRVSTAQKIMCWAYMSNIRSISKYDPHKKKYEMASGIDVKPVLQSNFIGGNETFFEVTRTKVG